MNEQRGKEPAYPSIIQTVEFPGMSTRLRIASEQMAGIMSHEDTSIDLLRRVLTRDRVAQDAAAMALRLADALLAADEERE